MKIMSTVLLALLQIIIISTETGAQTNPCTDPLATLTTVDSATKRVVMEISDYSTTFNGQPVWTDTELKAVTRGAGPDAPPTVPVLTIPKSAWTLVAGTTTCYVTSAAGAFLFSVPQNVELDLFTRKRTATTIGPWSTNSVPFGRPAPPSAGTGLRIIQ